ncbi:uncharacterized protein LOC107640214 [Arachis ipaensis]|uniref:uncharacterized protein LOC107640214 n=1 Tax=Arachis ipaensis TaxID=130454 RepID=UPI0007AF256D|nr:uncharacterized protein LOC107640214 [Arachis ipaensis]
MKEELEALEANNTWKLVPLPPTKVAIGCRWIYKAKLKADGSLEKYKARLVAKGYTQQAGIDFKDTFSPVAKVTTVRVLLGIAAVRKWHLIQLDITNAFLKGDLDEEVYMEAPMGHPERKKGLVCRLTKSLYGLPQASRQWFHKFCSTLKQNGFTQCKSDYSLFSTGSGDSETFLLVYVDDIIIAGANLDMMTKVQLKLQSIFKLKILGDLKFFLGLELAKSSQGISLTQRKYTLSLLDDTNLLDCKPATVPMDANLKLRAKEDDLIPDASAYRRLIGRLMYLTISRSDITFVVTKLAQFMSDPQMPHLQAAHQVLRYLKNAPGQGILFSAASQLTLSIYSDADWGSCLDTRRSTTGYCAFLGDSLITWKSKKQTVVSRSSTEAEYRSMAHASCEVVWLIGLLQFF